MSRGLLVCGVVAAVAGLAAWGPRSTSAKGIADDRAVSTPPVPVLVELFTSEGCSSCPPADLLLTRLAAEKTIDGVEIVPLAFHVDYWNRLGWTDRFSSPAYTDRQQRYASAWKTTDRVYTPQAVVDGRIEFLGTDVKAALAALADAGARPHARVGIDVLPAAASAGSGPASARRTLRVTVTPAAGAAFSGEVLLGVAEDGLSSQVTAGENANRRLEHTGVVRSLTRIGRIAKGAALTLDAVPVEIDARWKPASLRAVVIVQDEKTRAVHGVAQARLADAAAPASADAARVPFPADYQAYTVVRTANITSQNRLGTVYANGKAAAIEDVARLPYPNGSVIVMEWATPQKAADGSFLTDEKGLWRKGEIVRLDVMRREAGYGAGYATRAGEWEFASYRPDGKPFEPAIDAGACAACHTKPGAARDFVFRGRFPAAQ
jgi:hypothetical protein